MKKLFAIMAAVLMLAGCKGATGSSNGNITDFTVRGADGQPVALSQYKGQVLLVVNTATKCGFTPQYTELEQLYEQYADKGFSVLDFPCNQFGEGQRAEMMDRMMKRSDPDYAAKPDIKWNFTKFLVDRKGNVVARFEPTADMQEVAAAVAALL